VCIIQQTWRKYAQKIVHVSAIIKSAGDSKGCNAHMIFKSLNLQSQIRSDSSP